MNTEEWEHGLVDFDVPHGNTRKRGSGTFSTFFNLKIREGSSTYEFRMEEVTGVAEAESGNPSHPQYMVQISFPGDRMVLWCGDKSQQEKIMHRLRGRLKIYGRDI